MEDVDSVEWILYFEHIYLRKLGLVDKRSLRESFYIDKIFIYERYFHYAFRADINLNFFRARIIISNLFPGTTTFYDIALK